MAEVLAIVGGLAAFVQLSSTAARVARILLRFAMNAGAVSAQVKHFAHQVQTFSATVELARGHLHGYCTAHPKSPLVIHISSHKVLDNVLSEAQAIEDHLWDVYRQAKKLNSRSVIWASIKWSLKRSSILELSPEMQSLLISLNVLQSTVLLDLALRSPASDDSRRECEHLRGVIKALLKTLKHLHSQLFEHHQRDETRLYESLSLDYMRHGPLIELAESMCKHGTVPDPPRSSPSTSQHGIGDPRAPPEGPNGSQGSGSMTARTTTSSVPFRMESSVPRRRRVRRSRPPPPPEPRPVDKTLRVREGDLNRSIAGYVREPTGTFRYTTAYVAENLDGNIISSSRASELGLVVGPPGEDGDVRFKFDTGQPVHSIGRAVVQWRKSKHSDARYPTLTVTCDVCENTSVGLILGRPFLEEQARWWRRRNQSTSI
ncbi:hypothetical protein C8A03DRAFT_15257 [Achaetomium macrosporum]|uniref:Fungal N-terminal domain-containing protein n=1 Tax=Achaetomium macrosporum TaxID=79813 RepID=A0AAN7CBG2_9PEZI|nr:hypothetical protein C8A03DRAFT_15257 [Achaetomium macrosporum]